MRFSSQLKCLFGKSPHGFKQVACKNGEQMFPLVPNPNLRGNLLEGKTVLVTGGGSGLGKNIAERFARLGADVAIASRSLARVENAANELSDSTGRRIVALQMDVRNPEDCTRVFEEVEERFGNPANILVNSAAGNFICRAEDHTSNGLSSIVDIVFKGSIMASQAMYKKNRFKTPSCVLIIGANYSSIGAPFLMPSSASKAALDDAVKSLSVEWAKGGMRLNVLSPGAIYASKGMENIAGSFSADLAMEWSNRMTPNGRGIYGNEVANVAAFLCSEFGNAITGTRIQMDGGNSLVFSPTNYMHNVPDKMWTLMSKAVKKNNKKDMGQKR